MDEEVAATDGALETPRERKARVRAESLSFVRDEWNKDVFRSWLVDQGAVDDLDKRPLGPAEIGLAYDCATSALCSAFVDYVSELRSAEAIIEANTRRYADDPEHLAISVNAIRKCDICYNALFAELSRLNTHLEEGRASVTLVSIPGAVGTSTSSALSIHYRFKQRETSFVLQNGAWKVVLRLSDAAFTESDRTRILAFFGVPASR